MKLTSFFPLLLLNIFYFLLLESGCKSVGNISKSQIENKDKSTQNSLKNSNDKGNESFLNDTLKINGETDKESLSVLWATSQEWHEIGRAHV